MHAAIGWSYDLLSEKEQALFRREYDQELAAVRAALGEETFAAAAAEGRAMKMERTIEYALGTAV